MANDPNRDDLDRPMDEDTVGKASDDEFEDTDDADEEDMEDMDEEIDEQ
jgi:hypothetical protein